MPQLLLVLIHPHTRTLADINLVPPMAVRGPEPLDCSSPHILKMGVLGNLRPMGPLIHTGSAGPRTTCSQSNTERLTRQAESIAKAWESAACLAGLSGPHALDRARDVGVCEQPAAQPRATQIKRGPNLKVSCGDLCRIQPLTACLMAVRPQCGAW
jgi:hypothetical protein